MEKAKETGADQELMRSMKGEWLLLSMQSLVWS